MKTDSNAIVLVSKVKVSSTFSLKVALQAELRVKDSHSLQLLEDGGKECIQELTRAQCLSVGCCQPSCMEASQLLRTTSSPVFNILVVLDGEIPSPPALLLLHSSVPIST